MAHKNKSKMTNGHSKPFVNDSPGAKDSARESDDILKHISEISKVSGPHHLSKFVPVNGPSRADQERIIQQRKSAQPRNIRNIGLFENDSDDEQEKRESNKSEEFSDEHEIRAGIRAFNGGPKWSDSYIQDRWRRQPCENVEPPNFIERKKDASVTKGNQDVFARNVGMRSIVKQKMENKVDTTIKEDPPKSLPVNLNQDGENVGASNCNFPFVEDPIDPDFASRQFSGNDNKDDFLVEHVGKIVKVTPRQYLIENIDDADFAFSRADK